MILIVSNISRFLIITVEAAHGQHVWFINSTIHVTCLSNIMLKLMPSITDLILSLSDSTSFYMMAQNILRKVSQIFRSNNSDRTQSDIKAQRTQDSDLPENTNPSFDNPPIYLPTSPSTEIPRNILAFRTITTLLSKIQQEHAFQVKPRPILSSQKRQELEISNAFSTLAVFDSDIVAVVTKRTPYGLDIVASTTQISINEDPLITQSESPTGVVSQVWRLISRNYRWSDWGNKPLVIAPPVEPSISDAAYAEFLTGMDLADDEKLKLHVDGLW